ncbi:ABC transporter ATP-binding protein [Ideonella livida]|uniref:ABC transporter ATP-binding protein n=1 Tax=Ideonella livida TaxID=2707176 RepID=A0A7C9TMN3_9BURK|nr:ATP-binding cassette domain-containing protein [Ideonella livida]NDY91806.1 ABC transporter ATP-binding protein [Ideonella livida]
MSPSVNLNAAVPTAPAAASPSTPLLAVDTLCKHYGGLQVTRSVSLALQAGDRLALIGPNGAGKTTLVNQLSGVVAPSSGRIHLAGQDVTDLSQAQRVRRGLARTFQITTLAPTLTVAQQLALALFEREGLAGRWWRPLAAYPALAAEASALLLALGLDALANAPTARLAYGDQRLVELALALALRPRVLLLDEPMAGVPQAEGHRLLAALDRLPADMAVLLIEHDMGLVFRLATRIAVLAEGALLAEGPPEQIRQDPRVRAAYLGH